MKSGRLKIISSMLIWGSVGIFARFSNLDGLTLAFLRVLFGSLFFVIFYSLRQRSWLSASFQSIKPNVGKVFLLGTVLGLNWVFFFSAVLHTQIAKALMIYYLAPVIVFILASAFLGEKITPKRAVLISIAFLGSLIIVSQEEISFSNGDFLGILFALLAAFFYAGVTLLGRHLREIESSALTFFQLAFATLILAPFALRRGFTPSWSSFLVSLLIALIHTVFALLLYMQGLKEVEANESAILSYLDPMSAVLYAFLIFGEVPSLLTVIGGGLILTASLMDIMHLVPDQGT